MENKNINQEQSESVDNTVSQLHTITPLSKYLAMILFIALPFLGGWIGYTYAPEKIIEVEKVVVKEASTDSSDWALPEYNSSQNTLEDAEIEKASSIEVSDNQDISDWKMYRSHRYNFEISLPESYEVEEMFYTEPPTHPVFLFTKGNWEEGYINIAPQGAPDRGLREPDVTDNESLVGGVKADKMVFVDEASTYEYITFATSSLPSSWVWYGHRIDAKIFGDDSEYQQILSTFKFLP